METAVIDTPPSSLEDPLQREESSPPRCTLDCTRCSIATLLQQYTKAAALVDSAATEEQRGQLTHRANAKRQTARKNFLQIVTTLPTGNPTQRQRLAFAEKVHERFLGCHHAGVEDFRDDVMHILTVSAPQKIRNGSREDVA